MEKIDETVKNVTLSFKTTAEEKVALQQIANERHISRSELIASLVHAYKHSYDLIGKTSPKEEQLKLQLKDRAKENRKLNLALENTEHRIEIEQQLNRKNVAEHMTLNKTIFELQDGIKIKNKEIVNLLEIKKQLDKSITHEMDTKLFYSSLGSAVLAGIALIFSPIIFKN